VEVEHDAHFGAGDHCGRRGGIHNPQR
jgi:hypothetical protein